MPRAMSNWERIRAPFAVAIRSLIGCLLFGELLTASAGAQIVLSGLTTSFTKADGGNPTFAVNRDRITSSVLLTRSSSQGIFNAATENGYSNTSPDLTEWATDINNPNETISATNFGLLFFDPWLDAYGGLNAAGNNVKGRDAVLHIIPEDIYLDIRFTQWTMGAAGGGFSYQRSKTPDGDYNENGVVDAADYTAWRDTVGQSVVALGDGADGDLSGVIDQGDYDFWEAAFGHVVNTVDLGSGSIASRATGVPEPASIVSAALAVLLIGQGRPGRRPGRCSLPS